MHTSDMRSEEASPAPSEGHKHRRHHVRGSSQPSIREAHADPRTTPQATALPLQILAN